MLVMQPDQVMILTPKGTVIVARALYEALEQHLSLEEVPFMRHFEWLLQLGAVVNGICIQSWALPLLSRKESQP